MAEIMLNLCDGCIESGNCRIEIKGIDPRDCPCLNCLVKSMCRKTCDGYHDYAMKHEMGGNYGN